MNSFDRSQAIEGITPHLRPSRLFSKAAAQLPSREAWAWEPGAQNAQDHPRPMHLLCAMWFGISQVQTKFKFHLSMWEVHHAMMQHNAAYSIDAAARNDEKTWATCVSREPRSDTQRQDRHALPVAKDFLCYIIFHCVNDGLVLCPFKLRSDF